MCLPGSYNFGVIGLRSWPKPSWTHINRNVRNRCTLFNGVRTVAASHQWRTTLHVTGWRIFLHVAIRWKHSVNHRLGRFGSSFTDQRGTVPQWLTCTFSIAGPHTVSKVKFLTSLWWFHTVHISPLIVSEAVWLSGSALHKSKIIRCIILSYCCATRFIFFLVKCPSSLWTQCHYDNSRLIIIIIIIIKKLLHVQLG